MASKGTNMSTTDTAGCNYGTIFDAPGAPECFTDVQPAVSRREDPTPAGDDPLCHSAPHSATLKYDSPIYWNEVLWCSGQSCSLLGATTEVRILPGLSYFIISFT